MPTFPFPSDQIEIARSRNADVQMLEFSIYDAVAPSSSGARRTFLVESDKVAEWWKKSTASLQKNEEIGLNSRVKVHGHDGLLHIPMIDLVGANWRCLDEIKSFLRAECSEVSDIAWFLSGRSFHGYGEGLLHEDRWRYFMGTLLLFRPSSPGLAVDTRWIGHRLRDGYSCLRLTWNTPEYSGVPEAFHRPAAVADMA